MGWSRELGTHVFFIFNKRNAVPTVWRPHDCSQIPNRMENVLQGKQCKLTCDSVGQNDSLAP